MSDVRAPRPAVRWIILTFCVLVGLACFRLGLWQLDRLGQRRAQNALIRERTSLAPAKLGDALQQADPVYRSVTAHGRFDPAHAIYLADRALDEKPGMEVVAPLSSDEDGASILVDLGWVSNEAAGASPPSAWVPLEPVRLRGILRASQTEPRMAWLADPTPIPGAAPRTRWRVLSISGIQAQTPYPLSSYYLALTEPPTADSGLRPSPGLDLSQGPHLSYAIQWFAFGTTAIVGGMVLVRAGQRRRSNPTRTERSGVKPAGSP